MDDSERAFNWKRIGRGSVLAEYAHRFFNQGVRIVLGGEGTDPKQNPNSQKNLKSDPLHFCLMTRVNGTPSNPNFSLI
jgi:hypothetical protein